MRPEASLTWTRVVPQAGVGYDILTVQGSRAAKHKEQAMTKPVNWRQTKRGQGYTWASLLALLLVLLCAGPVLAAETRGGQGPNDVFHLPAGEVVNDDLYVFAGEVIIDGTVEGDLVAAGGYIEVNGTVTEDALLAGGGVILNGTVGDDVRVAGGGVTVAGQIGGDLFAAGGGPFWPGGPSFPITLNERTVAQGVRIDNSAQIAGDAYVAGGQGVINGTIGGNLYSGMGALRFGGQVQGDAELHSQALQVDDNARVDGNLNFSSAQPTTVPSDVATTVSEEPRTTAPPPVRPNPVWAILGWLWRTLLLAGGFALLAWLLWQLTPGIFSWGAAPLVARPAEAGLFGIVVAAVILPLILAFTLLAALFWGWLGALATSSFLFGAVGLVWLLSPVVTGYWISRWLVARGYLSSGLIALWAGVLIIVLGTRLVSIFPCVGTVAAGVIYLLSFVLTLGSLILARRQPATALTVS